MEYKNEIENGTNGKEYNASDKKKLLALPFLMMRRQEPCAPKKGQKEWDIFQ